ncbi:MAG: trypsin-like peptidase domain-containing protein [Chloroflexi bacterium]|nr:trypsin-like peptidase domain-containing protein [Chloroflexota bacterium]
MDPGLVIAPTLVVAEEEIEGADDPVAVELAAEPSCDPQFDEMMAATWKVNTTRWLGSAFHIGDGRFITAHHVIDDVPPFVTLTHGDRAIAAAVLGSDPSVDMALLGVFDEEAIADVPKVELRIPDQSHVGGDVFLIGYPGGGPLTVSFGGIISRVWEDEILTTSAGGGGNSGGPMFDECGDVVGVLWAGGSSGTFSHSGETLIRRLGQLRPRWPLLRSPAGERLEVPDGLLVWHYGSEPPDGVDCSGVDADIWIGTAGDTRNLISQLSHGLTYVRSCNWGYTRVTGYLEPPEDTAAPSEPEDGSRESSKPSCVDSSRGQADSGEIVREGDIGTILHKSTEEFGTITIATLDTTNRCPWQFNYQLRVDFDPPVGRGVRFRSALLDLGGARLEGPSPGYGTFDITPYDSSATKAYFQSWEVPPDFFPTALEFKIVALDRSAEEEWTIDMVPPAPEGPTFSQTLRIVVFVDSPTGSVRLCLQPEHGARACPASGQISLAEEDRGKWQASQPVQWLTELATSLLPEPDEQVHTVNPTETCALSEAVGRTSWQVSSIGDIGTAVYVGQGQFLVEASLVSEELPWVVVARGADVFPAVRVAEDARNGLALVEVIGGVPDLEHAGPARLGRIPAELDSATRWLVGYPWGDSDRFTVAVGEISDVTDRTFSFPSWGGWYRAGAPVVEPCTHEILGISLRSNRLLRADVIAESLVDLRRSRRVPTLPESGIPFHGSSSLWPYPVYVSTEQPDFGGWICNVRASERYDVYYAVYMARDSSFELSQVRDGNVDWVRTCGWSGKIFIVEYRSDEIPERICAEPRRPTSPLSTREMDFRAPDGVQLLQITDFVRGSCPGTRNVSKGDDRWSSDLYIKIRVTADLDLYDLVVEYYDDRGRKLRANARRDSYGDPDPDVIAWRVNIVEDREVAKAVVRVLR